MESLVNIAGFLGDFFMFFLGAILAVIGLIAGPGCFRWIMVIIGLVIIINAVGPNFI